MHRIPLCTEFVLIFFKKETTSGSVAPIEVTSYRACNETLSHSLNHFSTLDKQGFK
jgi:hypothetical protein